MRQKRHAKCIGCGKLAVIPKDKTKPYGWIITQDMGHDPDYRCDKCKKRWQKGERKLSKQEVSELKLIQHKMRHRRNTGDIKKLLDIGMNIIDTMFSILNKTSEELIKVGINRAEFSIPSFEDLYDSHYIQPEDLTVEEWDRISDEEIEDVGKRLCNYAKEKAEELRFTIKEGYSYPYINIYYSI